MDENYVDIPMLDSSEYTEIYSGIPWDGNNQYLKINLNDETTFKLVNPKNRLKRDDYYQIIIYQTSSGKGIISFDNIFKFSNKNEKAISKEKNSSTVFNLYSGIWGNSLDIISKKINSPKVRLGRTTLDASNVQNTSNVSLGGSGNVSEQQYSIATSTRDGIISKEDWNTFNSKQNSIVLDNNPTSNSSNLVSSGSIYSALQSKANTSDLTSYQVKSEKNQANGYVGLDSSSLINPNQIPDHHSAVTLGSNSNGLNLSNQTLSLNISNSTQTGSLSSSDWNIFNSKQDSLGILDYQIENILETPFTRSLRKISIYEDWIGSDIKGTIGWNSGVANSATLGIVSSIASPSNLGILGMSTQSNALGRSSIYTADSNGYGCGYMLEGNICMRWVVRISSLFSLGVDEFFIKIGLSNNVSSTTENCLNGVVFSYKGTSSAYWEIVGTNTGVETRINTTELVIANQWTILDMEYNNTDGAIFKINNNYVGTIRTNNLPTTVLLGLHARINKTLGTSNRSLYIDKCFFTRH